MVHVGRPRQDVLVEFRQPRRRRLVALEAGDAMGEKRLAGQALQGRQLAVIAIEPIMLIALVEDKAEPGRGGLEDRGPSFG